MQSLPSARSRAQTSGLSVGIGLDTQKAMRAVRELPFCYLCGKSLDPDPDRNDDDHIPPQAIFLPEDRDFPLILPTHRNCNNSQSGDDRVIGDLVGLMHGQKPSALHSKLKPVVWHDADGRLLGAVSGLDLRAIIRRWVRGFHAALYQEPLPDDPQSFMTSPPLPEADVVEGTPKADPPAEVVPALVKEIKRNRATGTLDRIVCCNGKLRYECVWTQADRGQWFCVYALDVYGWIDLGATPVTEPRGCVGAYPRPGGGTPINAATTTRLEFPVANTARLDPFGD